MVTIFGAEGEQSNGRALSLNSTSPPPPAICENTCRSPFNNGGDEFAGNEHCQDGGEGAEGNMCARGTDCTDCGPRNYSPPLSLIHI